MLSSAAISGSVPVTEASRAARMYGMLTPGSNFGVYVVGSCIGEGGMARIYRAEHAGLRRQVALKVLTNGFAKDPDGRERFVREARIAAAIKHPNVVNIFDVGLHEDIPYLVMELLEGTDLEALLKTKGALDESMILDIMVPVVAGLTAVHDAGIVHRDLKPGNIFLSKGRYDDLEPKLLDFGISKVAGPDQLKLTTHGLLVGTPYYMSPEALRGEEMTPLSDQYSLGVMMYECATGRAPFVASTFPDLFRAISNAEYLPLSEHPNVSKRLARIIQRAMSLDPRQRFSDLREMGRELLLLAGQRTRITWGLSFGESRSNLQASRASSMMPVVGSFRPRPAAPTGRRKLATGALLGAAALLMVGVVMVKRNDWTASGATPATGELPNAFSPALPAASRTDEKLRNEATDSPSLTLQGPEVVPLPDPTAAAAEEAKDRLSPKPELNARRNVVNQGRRVPPTPSPQKANEGARGTNPANSPAAATPRSGGELSIGPNGAPIFD